MAAESAEKHRNTHVITLTGYLIGLPVESVLRIALRPPHQMEFKQVRGTLRALSGQCSLQAVEDGTEVRYRLEADPGIPMISDEAARQFLVQFVERMLDRIKLAAERKAPTRRAERVSAAGSPGVEIEADEAEAPEEIAAAVSPEGDVEAPADEPPDIAAGAPPASEPPAPPPAAAPGQAPGRTQPTRSGRRRRRRRHRGRGRISGPPGPGAAGPT